MQTRTTQPAGDRLYRQLRHCALEDGLRLLHFSHADRRNLSLYLRDQYRTPA